MTPGLILLVLGLAVLGVVGALIANLRRSQRAREVQAGLEVLRTLRWKEFTQHVQQTFEKRSFHPEATPRKPGEDGVDLVLVRAGQRHLLQVKHGGAYHVGATPVRRLASMLESHGATGGILVTSGGFDDDARAAAQGQPVTLLDGDALWTQLQDVLPPALIDEAAARAAEGQVRERSRLNLGLVAGGALALLGGALFAFDRLSAGRVDDDGPAPARTAEAAAPAAAAPAPAAPAATGANPAAPSIAPAPALSEAQMAQHRDFAAASALLVDGVLSATWPSKSTLQISVRAGSDAERDAIVAKLCAELTRREHLRFTRLQVQDLSANGEVQGGVRWRQCQ
ncbi:MAG TPA: restriction endonuclease [Pseudomonadota bacterium]|nr:restriction endonuclease [Pseudomonadota bacterium]